MLRCRSGPVLQTTHTAACHVRQLCFSDGNATNFKRRALVSCSVKTAQSYCTKERSKVKKQAVRADGVSTQLPDTLNFTVSRLTKGLQGNIYFPFDSSFVTEDGKVWSASQVLSLLSPLLTVERLQRMKQVVNGRTFSVTPVLEGLYDAGNVGAVCRSADALGFGAVHVINSRRQPFKQSRGRNSAGAEKWIDLRIWTSASACVQSLKDQGFKVLATSFSPQAVPITHWDWTQPTAVVLGNESAGVSEEAVALADALTIIPMQGCMVDSFNVSVAAALIMWEARAQRDRTGSHADLTEQQREVLLALMALRSKGRVKQGPLVESIDQLMRAGVEAPLT